MRAVRAARAKVTVAALPCSRTRPVLNAGAGSPSGAFVFLAARVLAVYQVSPRQTVAVTSPNAIQPSAWSCTIVKPSQNPSPTIANAGWANSSSDRSPGMAGAFLAAVSEGGSNRSRAARRISRLEAARDAEPAAAAGTVAGSAGAVAGSAGAGSVAGMAAAGRARPRLLVTSR